MDNFPVNKFPLNVLTHIASFLLPSKFKFLTIRNLGDYLDYSDLLPFRETSAEFKNVADDLFLHLVNQIITQLGISLDLKTGHLPTEGYSSAFKFIQSITVLNKLFNESEYCIVYSNEIESPIAIGSLRTIQKFTFPKQNVVSPYIFHLLCQAFPQVAANLCKFECSWEPMGIDGLKKQVYKYAFVPRLNESIYQPAINNNQSALFALHYYKLSHPDNSDINFDTETAIDRLFKKNDYAKKLDRKIFKAWSLNFYKSKHLKNEQLLTYKNRIIEKLTKDKVDTSHIVEKLLHRVLSNALFTEDVNQSIEVCL